MKFTKMSLVAALLIGSSAFALDNTKVSGNAQLFYSTSGKGANRDLFDKDASAADAGLNLNVTTDLIKNDMVAISAGAGYTVLSTLGLENNLVSGVWGSSHTVTAGTGASFASTYGGAKVENSNWMNEAWIAATAGKTTAKIGRMELDTPLVFTEKWSIEKNTFESAVIINQDIPDTTLVGAYVGNGNGTPDGKVAVNGINLRLGAAMGGVVNTDGKFTTYGGNGAYAIGAINNSFKPLTVQAWYYSLTQLATAYWLQADLNAGSLGVDGLTAGVQYSSASLKHGNTDASSTVAVELGYGIKDVASFTAAYSSVDKKGVLGAANTATASGASKLYTEAWWNYGQVTALDTDSYMLRAEANVASVDVMAQYTNANHKAAGSKDMNEFAATATKSFGPLDTTLAYVYAKTNKDYYSMIQAYLTLKF